VPNPVGSSKSENPGRSEKVVEKNPSDIAEEELPLDTSSSPKMNADRAQLQSQQARKTDPSLPEQNFAHKTNYSQQQKIG